MPETIILNSIYEEIRIEIERICAKHGVEKPILRGSIDTTALNFHGSITTDGHKFYEAVWLRNADKLSLPEYLKPSMDVIDSVDGELYTLIGLDPYCSEFPVRMIKADGTVVWIRLDQLEKIQPM